MNYENAIMILATRVENLETEVKGRNRPISFIRVVDGKEVKFYITGTDPVQDKQIIDNTYMAINYAKKETVIRQDPDEAGWGKEK